MANEIAQALGQSAQTTAGRQGFRAGSGTGYQAARIAKPVLDTSLGDAMRNFVKAGGDSFASYEQNRKSQADERSNEIIRKLTPEQRRQAIGEGTLLYADDPDAMQQLRLKSGRNAAYEVDNEVQTEIQKGSFRSRKELDEWRQTRMGRSPRTTLRWQVLILMTPCTSKVSMRTSLSATLPSTTCTHSTSPRTLRPKRYLRPKLTFSLCWMTRRSWETLQARNTLRATSIITSRPACSRVTATRFRLFSEWPLRL